MNITEEQNDYENTKNTLGILRILSQSEKEIEDNEIIPQDKVFKKLEKNLKNE